MLRFGRVLAGGSVSRSECHVTGHSGEEPQHDAPVSTVQNG